MIEIASPPNPPPTRLSRSGEEYVARLLEELGEGPSREGLTRTPYRVWQSLSFLTDGYRQDVAGLVGDVLVDERYDETVLLHDIEFYSLCEHHLLPFFGRAHVAYIPDGRSVERSTLPRIVDLFSHRLQVQERLTTQIAAVLEDVLHPKGVAVVLSASHLCLMMRGVRKQNTCTVTLAMRGIVKTDQRIRSEVLDLLGCR